MKETIKFTIPGSMVEINLQENKNQEWKVSIRNILNNSIKIIKKSISETKVTNIINSLTTGSYNKFFTQSLERECKELRKKVENIQKNKLKKNK